ncbi:MAG: ABC transporter permease [Deltaproteobacteria bacterium]|nr:ABC transporter permease [Deltaproteobacteria bacterium]
MWTYAIRRVLLAIPTILILVTLIFFFIRVVPGDLALLYLGPEAGIPSEEQLRTIRHQLGVDRPLYQQYGEFIWGLVRLDLGRSMWTRRPVFDELTARLPLTFELALGAIVLSIVLALPLGVIAGVHQDTWADYIIRVVSIGGIAAPSFWIAILILFFLLWLFVWSPPMQFSLPWEDPAANMQQMIWPIMAIGYRTMAVLTRMMRSSILEVIREDYIRTARAKGLAGWVVVIRHAVRNALLPVITIIGLEFAFLMGGTLTTEVVFNLNGVGRFLVDAVTYRDYTVIQALVVMAGVFFTVVNLSIDLVYGWIDPRITYK